MSSGTHTHILAGTALLVCIAFLASAAQADGTPRGRAPVRMATGCPVAGRAAVIVPPTIDGIDGIRVFVDAARPGAATDVTVLAGGRDRTLRARGAGEFALLLDEPLRARRIEIALEPVLEAPAAACVDRVELLRGGAVVGTAEIK